MSRHNPENSAETRKGMCASEHACVCKKREREKEGTVARFTRDKSTSRFGRLCIISPETRVHVKVDDKTCRRDINVGLLMRIWQFLFSQ